jgi:hypothetical protein
MRNNILTRLLLFGIFALTTVSCEEDSTNTSIVTSFEEIPITLGSSPVTVPECGVTETFNFTLGSENQLTDMTLEVGVGSSSTATEGVDFTVDTHEIELSAFEGQDGFSVDITVLQDFEIEAGDEEVYLVFTSTDPSGISKTETKVITIEDSGLDIAAASTADFTLSWDFDDPDLSATDPCFADVDMTFQTAGGAPYDDDLLGFGAASLDCPEVATLDIASMVEGEVYEVWILFYGGTDFSPESNAMTITVDYSRGNSTFNGSVGITGTFDATMPGNGGVLMTIEKNCNVLTLRAASNGTILGEGRISQLELQSVEKPS